MPVEACPICGQNRHRDDDEYWYTPCMACRMRGVEHDHIIHDGWKPEEEDDGKK